MPNGHNATPRFYHPAVLLAAAGACCWFYAERPAVWWAVAAVAAAGAFGWCLSFNWVMWDAMEYGGAYTPAEQLAVARRKHRVRAPLLAACCVGVVVGALVWIGNAR